MFCIKPIAKRALGLQIILLCGFICAFVFLENANGQSFRRQFPKVQPPVVALPNYAVFTSGNPFAFTPVHKANKLIDLDLWERVKELETLYPTFNGANADIENAEIALRWAQLYKTARNLSLETKLKYVEHFFNQWPYISDARLWKIEDHWAAPREFMLLGGDCEDFAIAKFYALKALGVPAGNMCVAVVNDFKAVVTHAVLVVSHPNGRDFYVLDNAAKGVYKNGTQDAYTPVCFVNESAVWQP